VYGDRVENRPELGEGRAPDASDIERAVRLSRAVGVAALVAACAIAALGNDRGMRG
jgi:adenosylcobinamide-phosphate synthase